MKSLERRARVSASGQPPPNVRDRRVDRTRRTVIAAFNTLLLSRGYSRVTVREIIARADVGRSTFYEHFQNKQDVLSQSLEPVLAPLADAVRLRAPDDRLRFTLAHMWENRRLVGPVLLGSSRGMVARLLADLIDERLAGRREARAVPHRLLAAALAGAQLALLEAWTSSTPPLPVETVARALVAISHASGGTVQTR